MQHLPGVNEYSWDRKTYGIEDVFLQKKKKKKKQQQLDWLAFIDSF